jgi:hypothetical protein
VSELLEQATRALRERTASGDDRATGGGEETLARVVSVIRRRARRRRQVMVIGLQLAIGTAGLGAWAAVSGRLESLLQAWRPSPAGPAPTRALRPRPAPAPVATPPLLSPEPPALPAAPPPAPPPRPPARRMAARAPAPAPAAAPPTAQAAEALLYRQAHEAHFDRRDFAAALVAWNRYLALERPGRFALEARYNRAIALYRLGRHDEAARALRPFAGGDYGPYRQPEARALLQRLGRSPP